MGVSKSLNLPNDSEKVIRVCAALLLISLQGGADCRGPQPEEVACALGVGRKALLDDPLVPDLIPYGWLVEEPPVLESLPPGA